MERKLSQGLLAALALTVALPALAQDQTRTQTTTQEQMQEQMRDQQMYGYQLMTPEERDAYRERMRNAATAEEQERIRAEHHEQMTQRAQQRGVTLPDEPPPRGSGMNRGSGMGPGGSMGPGGTGSGGRMGPGGGMGPGDSMGPSDRRGGPGGNR